jgi:hypothetical protein
LLHSIPVFKIFKYDHAFFSGFHASLYSMGLYDYVSSCRPLSCMFFIVFKFSFAFYSVTSLQCMWHFHFLSSFLNAFENCEERLLAASCCSSVRLSVCPHGTPWLLLDESSWKLIFESFWKICQENSSFITIGQEWRYCTWRPMYIFDYISLSSSYNKTVSTKSCRENQNTHFIFNNFFLENRVICEMTWKNAVEPGRPQMTIWRMRIACWVQKVTNTRSERVIHIVFHNNNGSTNTPRCYVTRTLPVLFLTKETKMRVTALSVCLTTHVLWLCQ